MTADRFPKTLKRQLVMRAIAASLIIGLSIFWAVNTARHHGSGIVTSGGDEPGTGGAIATDEKEIMVSEAQYKRKNYVYSGSGVFIGMMILRSAFLKYRETFGGEAKPTGQP